MDPATSVVDALLPIKDEDIDKYKDEDEDTLSKAQLGEKFDDIVKLINTERSSAEDKLKTKYGEQLKQIQTVFEKKLGCTFNQCLPNAVSEQSPLEIIDLLINKIESYKQKYNAQYKNKDNNTQDLYKRLPCLMKKLDFVSKEMITILSTGSTTNMSTQ